jgi:hypothetical protein
MLPAGNNWLQQATKGVTPTLQLFHLPIGAISQGIVSYGLFWFGTMSAISKQ